jgi:hypothetical protein
MGLENVDIVLAPFLQTSDIDWINQQNTKPWWHYIKQHTNGRLRDKYELPRKQTNRSWGSPFGEYSLCMRRTSFQIHLSTITVQADICSVR